MLSLTLCSDEIVGVRRNLPIFGLKSTGGSFRDSHTPILILMILNYILLASNKLYHIPLINAIFLRV